MKKIMNITVRIVLFLPLLVLMICVYEGMAAENYKPIELDKYISNHKGKKDGKVVITMADPISFQASVKRYPEEKNLEYVYTALTMAAMRPIPEVKHRMFIETQEGEIFPVYVELNAANKIKYALKEGDNTRFLGYHLYNYSKGPAIMVVDFTDQEQQ
jgi:hypothetical protein